ncbi:MAG: hypothetical protein AB2L24_01120 [Mangrovibacterium sp.]
MKKIVFCLLLLFPFSLRVLSDNRQGIPVDRWFEIDLYWFEKNDINGSVSQFWDRFHPLFEGLEGEKGIILNIGWLMDYVFSWSGNLTDEIRFPKDMGKHPGFKDEGLLYGSTQTRRQQAIDRFAEAGDYVRQNYEKWTYEDLKKLVSGIKRTAQTKYKINVRVGSFILAWERIYGGQKSLFSSRHPGIYDQDIWFWGTLNVTARLEEDHTSYGAYPRGITKGTPVTEFFGKQWGHFSKTTGLDALVIRDSGMGPGIYKRTGPFGDHASSDPVKVAEWSKATADLVRYTKLANPNVFVMGYSNGCAAVGDWRVNCFDLEAIAKEGYLDAYIDQSWAGAWNELGQRPEQFWNRPQGGWTYQMAYILVHAAVLADTRCKHYILTETFDAWESWDILHTVPDRLKWGIWAYSHAAVKTLKGLKMPAGSYISWANQGKRLLTEDDVDFITKETNNAFRDAYQTKEVYGPTLVYCRSAMEWQNTNAPDRQIKEWIDEQAAALMTFSLPVMSSTRLEYLPEVTSDLFIFQTPVHLKAEEKNHLMTHLKGKPFSAVFGSPAGGIDPAIQKLIGIETRDTVPGPVNCMGSLKGRQDALTEGLPNTFLIFQPFTRNELTDKKAEVFYYVDGSPALVGNKNLIFWDTAEIYVNIGDRNNKLLDEILGSVYPWALTSRVLNNALAESGKIHVESINPICPVFYGAWQTRDNQFKILTAQLEEGINHQRDKSVKATIRFPEGWKKNRYVLVRHQWDNRKLVITGNELDVHLSPAEVKLLILE